MQDSIRPLQYWSVLFRFGSCSSWLAYTKMPSLAALTTSYRCKGTRLESNSPMLLEPGYNHVTSGRHFAGGDSSVTDAQTPTLCHQSRNVQPAFAEQDSQRTQPVDPNGSDNFYDINYVLRKSQADFA
jgi:hypothetical protein